MHEHVTLLRPDVRGPEASGISWTLPPDLLGQSAARLRILALLYALAFFPAGLFPVLLIPAVGLCSSGASFNGALLLAEVIGATAWTQDRARDWWATHQPVLTS